MFWKCLTLCQKLALLKIYGFSHGHYLSKFQHFSWKFVKLLSKCPFFCFLYIYNALDTPVYFSNLNTLNTFFSPLPRINRLQLPLFPKGHPWSIWGWSFCSASFRLTGGGLPLQQGCRIERHATQYSVNTAAGLIELIKTWKLEVGERKVRGSVEERLRYWGSPALHLPPSTWSTDRCLDWGNSSEAVAVSLGICFRWM